MNTLTRGVVSSSLLLFTLLFLPGCLVSSTNSETVSGNYVPQDTFDRIKTGETTSGWVQATLGEPSSKDKVENGNEVWKYSYTEVKEGSGAIFLIFGGTNKKEMQRNAYVEFHDGVVSNKWRS